MSSTHLHIRIETRLKEQLSSLASQQNTTVSALVITLVSNEIFRAQQENSKSNQLDFLA